MIYSFKCVNYRCRRVLHFVLEKISYLSEKAKKQNNSKITIPFNRQQFVDFLSVDRSAMSNELRKMHDEGMIEFEKSSFKLLWFFIKTY